MEKVRPRCGQRSDRGRLKNRTATRVNADDDDDDEVGGCASEAAAAAGGVTGARHNSTCSKAGFRFFFILCNITNKRHIKFV